MAPSVRVVSEIVAGSCSFAARDGCPRAEPMRRPGAAVCATCRLSHGIGNGPATLGFDTGHREPLSGAMHKRCNSRRLRGEAALNLTATISDTVRTRPKNQCSDRTLSGTCRIPTCRRDCDSRRGGQRRRAVVRSGRRLIAGQRYSTRGNPSPWSGRRGRKRSFRISTPAGVSSPQNSD